MKKIFSAITATILLLSMCTIAYASENTEKAADSLYGMAITVGMIAGIFPARRATKMSAIEAIRAV